MTEDVPDPDLYDSLEGQVALVTGANRGIGREIAEQLHDLGATVFAATRSITHEIPDEWEHLLVDVTQEGEISDAVDDVYGSAGRLDILVNNAAVSGGDGVRESLRDSRANQNAARSGNDIVAESVKDIDRTLATNLRGPMLVCKHAVPLLVQDEGGRVVNVSSGMGALGEEQSGGSPSYRISKTGLNGLTKYLDGEYGDDGLVANSVCPGWVRTDMGGEEANRSVERGAETPVYLCRFEPGSPSGYFWRDREVVDW